jgi:hypothetical protein
MPRGCSSKEAFEEWPERWVGGQNMYSVVEVTTMVSYLEILGLFRAQSITPLTRDSREHAVDPP